MSDLLARLTPAARDLLAACGAAADELGGAAFLVGGPVRDLILGRGSDDLDVVVVGDGMATAQAVARSLDGRLTRFHAFQTARVDLPDGRKVDFATARSERYRRPGALPEVRSGLLEEDLARRDFSINTMALSISPTDEATLVDPYGGVEDLEAGRIRILHERSFADDPTRMLRAVRFATRFGFELDATTSRALREAVRGGYLAEISGDRLRRELQKLLAEAPVDGPMALERARLLAQIHPALRAPAAALAAVPSASVAAAIPEAERWGVVLAVIAGALGPQDRRRLARRLRLSREQRRALVDSGAPWTRAAAALAEAASAGAAAEALDSVAPAGLAAVLATLEAAGDPVGQRVRRYLTVDRHVVPALDGDALRALGFPEGPALGEALRHLRAGRLDGTIEDETDERVLAAEMLAALPNGADSGAN